MAHREANLRSLDGKIQHNLLQLCSHLSAQVFFHYFHQVFYFFDLLRAVSAEPSYWKNARGRLTGLCIYVRRTQKTQDICSFRWFDVPRTKILNMVFWRNYVRTLGKQFFKNQIPRAFFDTSANFKKTLASGKFVLSGKKDNFFKNFS